MPITVCKLRFLLIASAALVGAPLLTGNAAASCKSMPYCARCPAVGSNCCKVESVTPIQVASKPTMVDRQIPLPNGGACPNMPGCCCQPQSPASPKPKGQEERENNVDPARDVAASGWLGIGTITRSLVDVTSPKIRPS